MWVAGKAVTHGWLWLGIAATLIAGCAGQVVDRRSSAAREDAATGSGGRSAPSGMGWLDGSGSLRDGGNGGTGNGGNVGPGGSSNTGGIAGDGAGAPLVTCDVDGSVGSGSPAHVDMNTICGIEIALDCTQSAESLLRGYVCGPTSAPPTLRPGAITAPVMMRTVGCGFETIEWNGGFGGPSYTFRLSNGEFVGARVSSDVTWGPCNTSIYVAGQTIDCPDARHYSCVSKNDLAPDSTLYNDGPCSLEKEEALRALPDRPDCDCSQPPLIDPCFTPTGCGCWCGQIEGLKEQCPGVR